jgi:single-strand DNA-binding protein
MLPRFSNIYRLAKDPETRFTADGKQITSLLLACSEKYGETENKLFLSATAFGKTAEFIESIKKGQRVFCQLKLKTDQWTDNQGNKKSAITAIVENFEYVEKKEAQPQQPQKQAPQQQQPFEDEFDQEIPF